jgi:hypothetical protein
MKIFIALLVVATTVFYFSLAAEEAKKGRFLFFIINSIY